MVASPLPPFRKKLQKPLLLFAFLTLGSLGFYSWRIDEFHKPVSTPRVVQYRTPSFDLSQLTLPLDQVRSGGVRKDGIPAIDAPKFVAAGDASFMQDSDQVIGVARGDDAKAYPLKILDLHEAVNDRLDGLPIAVTYCPLCDSSVVFDRRVAEREIELGISGLLYNSNVLLFDRGQPGKESLWSQMMSRAVSGPSVKQPLRRLPLEVTSWAAWRQRYPQTSVLSDDTGHPRQYDRTVYARYFSSPRLMFRVNHQDQRLPAKTPVLGVTANGSAMAFAVDAYLAQPKLRTTHQLAGKQFTIVGDSKGKSLRVEQADEGVDWVYAFWFAWSAFEPKTDLWTAEP